MTIISWIWFFSLMLLTGYHLVIFRRRQATSTLPYLEWPGISIVIAHKNDTKSLKRNLQSIRDQDYPQFEIIVVDDNSTPVEKEILGSICNEIKKVKILHASSAGKKNAISQGVQSARFEIILCTDADCSPNSNQWIKKMVHSGRGSQMVLGYSPYRKMNGWLNQLVRFETLMTAMQYISWTWSGKPYMGVGRNMLYHRSLFAVADAYNNSVPYGDDDFIVQAAAEKTRIKVCVDANAHVYSEPPQSLKEWLRQKHRHLSAAHHYRKSALLQPGIYGVAFILHWFLMPILWLGNSEMNWLPVFIAGLLIRWIHFASWTKILGSKDLMAWYPFLEIQYAAYLYSMGIFTLVNKKTKWN